MLRVWTPITARSLDHGAWTMAQEIADFLDFVISDPSRGDLVVQKAIV